MPSTGSVLRDRPSFAPPQLRIDEFYSATPLKKPGPPKAQRQSKPKENAVVSIKKGVEQPKALNVSQKRKQAVLDLTHECETPKPSKRARRPLGDLNGRDNAGDTASPSS
ncbi:hypothetical protein SISNIDRAFT_60576 [Sistotremastrum niveocremeum HHB9708]|uniref:Uncharacterized protein n=2 Tax=Sistotremastraceae TaxID=3402574 RepID=A0A164VG65_9AGAM|nr:hypothetical protein SISNIDRAFT_60576 [Sistotremastrum niveocremeum HHB9708]KZT35563.1 hypothetical protein SISSUDRAFT_156643 [Sistotremastrum suecicum HHB10207 ss-3]